MDTSEPLDSTRILWIGQCRVAVYPLMASFAHLEYNCQSLNQRIGVRYRLVPMDLPEALAYVDTWSHHKYGTRLAPRFGLNLTDAAQGTIRTVSSYPGVPPLQAALARRVKHLECAASQTHRSSKQCAYRVAATSGFTDVRGAS